MHCVNALFFVIVKISLRYAMTSLTGNVAAMSSLVFQGGTALLRASNRYEMMVA